MDGWLAGRGHIRTRPCKITPSPSLGTDMPTRAYIAALFSTCYELTTSDTPGGSRSHHHAIICYCALLTRKPYRACLYLSTDPGSLSDQPNISMTERPYCRWYRLLRSPPSCKCKSYSSDLFLKRLQWKNLEDSPFFFPSLHYSFQLAF
jgi:hypothetical protein